MDSNLNSLFDAKSIAIVGVSAEKTKIGSVILHNLLQSGYKGHIYPVNPKYQVIDGMPCYGNITLIPDPVELVCVAVPSKFVRDIAKDCVTKGVKAVVIITAGFGEVGEEGKAAEKELTTLLSSAGIRLLGPNCLGFMNTTRDINLTFAATYPEKGDIAVLSQSGAICTALLDTAAAERVGFSHIVSVGNKADVGELDLLPYFLGQPEVKVIGAYLENIEYGKNLVETYAQSEVKKPFIVIKPGVTKQAVNAIKSHTGAITSSEKAYQVSLAQHGIVQVSSITEFYKLMKTFSWLPPSKGKNAVIVTNAGGPGIMATDEVVLSDLVLYKLSDEAKQKLKQVLPPEASVHNPVDLLGDALADRYTSALQLLEQEPEVDVVLVLVSPQFVTDIPSITEAIIAHMQHSTKMIIPVYLGKKVVSQGVELCEAAHIPAFTSITQAVRVIDTVTNYYIFHGTSTEKPVFWTESKGQIKVTSAKVLSTEEAMQVLDTYGIKTLQQSLVHSLPEAITWAEERYPVVLKIPNEILAHKTEEKGVLLHIDTSEKLTAAWNTLSQKAPYLLIQEQLNFEEQLFIGANRDGIGEKGFGQLLVFGQGGIYTEIQKDFGYATVPASRTVLLEQLAKTRVSKVLVGARNKPPLAVAKYIELIERIQQLLLDNPHFVSMDINPVLITETEVYPVDVKIYLG